MPWILLMTKASRRTPLLGAVMPSVFVTGTNCLTVRALPPIHPLARPTVRMAPSLSLRSTSDPFFRSEASMWIRNLRWLCSHPQPT